MVVFHKLCTVFKGAQDLSQLANSDGSCKVGWTGNNKTLSISRLEITFEAGILVPFTRGHQLFDFYLTSNVRNFVEAV